MASLDNIENYLTHFARVFLEAGTYNAAKHGLAITTGNSGMELSGIPELSKEGPAIEYLAPRKADDGRQRWALHTKWIDIDRSIAYVHIAARLIQVLWEIASWRYVGRKPERFVLFTHPKHSDLEPKEAIQVGTVSMDLLYYATE